MAELAFEMAEESKAQTLFLDSRMDASDTAFVVFLLEERLHTITLSRHRASVNYKGVAIGSMNDQLWIGGARVPLGRSFVKKLGCEILAISQNTAQTMFFLINREDYFVIGSDEIASIGTQSDGQVVIHEERLSLDGNEDFLYFNNRLLKGHHTIQAFKTGDRILTPDYLLEKRRNQWKLTAFTHDLVFEKGRFLRQPMEQEFPEDFPKYRRSPRLHLEPPEDKFKIEKIEAAPKANKNGILKAILPPIGMLAVTGLTSVLSGQNPLMMLGMGFMSLITAAFTVSQYFTEKKERKIEAEKRQENYDVYLVNVSAEIGKPYKEERQILNFRNPSPEALSEMIETYDSRIYERMGNNKDFLEVSLGTGNQASHLSVTSDINQRETDDNTLRVKKLIDLYSTQRKVPITLNVTHQTLGLVGTYPVTKTAAQNLLFQVAFFHSYRDVNFVSLVPEKSYKKDWGSWRFLPHFKLQELGLRGLIHNAKTRDIVLSSFYQLLNKRKQILQESGKEKPQFSPHYIFSIFDDSYLAGHGMNEFLAEDMSELGVTVIWAKEDQKLLPETVTALVAYKSQSAGEIINDNNVYVAKAFQAYPALPRLEASLRQLSNLEHVEVEKNAIPESLSLLEQYEVKSIEELKIKERWEEAEPNKSIKSLIGWRGKREYMYWDLHERVHGPHALVGGTTGSGKSEFLTTYLIGLAINFSPEDIGMLIIDWKGGGIANTLAGLPHFMGSITNLDGAGTARALASINAELKKRQREFAKYGVNNINGYMSLYKKRHEAKPDVVYPEQPIPHLVLVSDEFAELKSNVPEFLDELTSVARIGRSLGVHLILATQKPSGVVNDQIEANSTSKIALKMASEQDSNELLKTHDAAHITQPGRGYLKVGQNEVYELFQSGYAGLPYDPTAVQTETIDERIHQITDLGQTEVILDPSVDDVQGHDTSDLPTQLEAVIEEIDKLFKASGLTLPAKPWLPNLETSIPTIDVKKSSERQLEIPLGLLDLPSQQRQEVYHYDIQSASHTVIFASPGYGKSTTLQTIVMNLARQNTPEQVQFYLLDFGTNGLLPLKDLPHVIDITTADNVEKVGKMLVRIKEELSTRKQLFAKLQVANINQYQQNQPDKQLSIQLVVLDNYDTIAESPNRDSYDVLISQLLREGAALGMYLILTANRVGTLRMSMLSNIQSKIALYLLNKDEVTTLYGRDRLEAQAIAGRGQLLIGSSVQAIQIYLSTQGEKEAELYQGLEKEIKTINNEWTGKRPEAIPMVAEEVKVLDFFEDKGVRIALNQNKLPIGFQKASAALFSVNLSEEDYFGIISDDRKRTQQIVERLLDAYYQLADRKTLVIFDSLKWLKDMEIPDSIELTQSSLKDYQANESLEDKYVLIVNAEQAFSGIILLDDVRKLLDEISYLILISESQWINKIMDVSKYFKANLRYGLMLKKMSEQMVIPNTLSGKEAELLDDEAYAFRGRDVRKLRLTQLEVKETSDDEF